MPASPPILSYQTAPAQPPCLPARIALACAIGSGILFAALIAFSRLIVGPAYRQLITSSTVPTSGVDSQYQRYETFKAIAVTLFLILLAALAAGLLCAIFAIIKHPPSRKRATLAIALCLLILAALAVTT